jgi:hypothetical protein
MGLVVKTYVRHLPRITLTLVNRAVVLLNRLAATAIASQALLRTKPLGGERTFLHFNFILNLLLLLKFLLTVSYPPVVSFCKIHFSAQRVVDFLCDFWLLLRVLI